MSDIRQMSVGMQRLVDFISMVTNSTLLRNKAHDQCSHSRCGDNDTERLCCIDWKQYVTKQINLEIIWECGG
jgi:hypothetical protein